MATAVRNRKLWGTCSPRSTWINIQAIYSHLLQLHGYGTTAHYSKPVVLNLFWPVAPCRALHPPVAPVLR